MSDQSSSQADDFESDTVVELLELSESERISVELKTLLKQLENEFMERLREEFSDHLRNYRDYVINNFEPDRDSRNSRGVVRGDELDAIEQMGSRSEMMEQEFENRARQIFEELLEDYNLKVRLRHSEAE